MAQVLVPIDDVPRESGGQEPHDVGEAVGDAQQGPSKVGRHVNVGAHES